MKMKTKWGIFDKETNELVMHRWSQSYVSRGCVYETEVSAKRGLRGITGGQSDKYYVAEFKPSFIVKIDPMELEYQPLKGQVQYSDEELRDTSADWFPKDDLYNENK
jgi:hypothetical protein